MPAKARPQLSTEQVRAALQRRYQEPEWALLQEVPNATGYDKTRTADALAMNLWPSRGCAVHGFEIKVSRSDWLRELKDPSKADTFITYCDYWWLVVGDKEIVQADELPPTWGLMVPRGEKQLVVLKEAPPSFTPSALGRPQIAAMLRAATRANNRKDKHLIEEEVNRRWDEARAQLERESSHRVKQLELELEGLRAGAQAFREKAGVGLGAGAQWLANTASAHQALAELMRLAQQSAPWRARELGDELVEVAGEVKRGLAEFERLLAQVKAAAKVEPGAAEVSHG